MNSQLVPPSKPSAILSMIDPEERIIWSFNEKSFAKALDATSM
jgi:hypothetical protein